MNVPKHMHFCTHVKKQDDRDGMVKEVTIINNGTQRDILIDKAKVLEILEVRAIEFERIDDYEEFEYDMTSERQTYDDPDPTDGFYDGDDEFLVDYRKYFQEGAAMSNPLPKKFYERFLHNRIKWNVKPPTKYYAKIRVFYPTGNQEFDKPDECRRCLGRGWFIDLFDEEGRYANAEGVHLVLQKVVKDLLTKLGSSQLEEEYGTTLHATIMHNSKHDDDLFDNIRLIVSEVEDKYLEEQVDYRDGLSDEETFVSLRVKKVYKPPTNPRIVVIELLITTMATSGNFRLGF
jgi:hypothetical protein